ncbi:hypothetical protein [Amycolatopsis thermophila]|uniref:Uncharacterized protein n=1 Tax=Amycolatopsis thermophila TaxID=206084 RepID=A0ABU0ENB6_9PSEU|nr:hypothetical protein [Amycolatopsis thermophila]MDQ0376538.1 hypothetical protein [Amycolatopsis thermophila]
MNRTFPNLASTVEEMRKSMQEHYGVWVCFVGDDGDLVALGHHEPKRVLAAFNRYCRIELSMRNVADDRDVSYKEAAEILRWRHGRLITACESPDHDDEIRMGHSCHQCALLGGGGEWWLDWSNPEHPDAFPITMWQV